MPDPPKPPKTTHGKRAGPPLNGGCFLKSGQANSCIQGVLKKNAGKRGESLGRLKEEQLGKLNAQFNTAEQAMIDMKNAALNAGSEISKLFGPTMVAGLRLLTGALKGINDQLKFYSDTQAALKNYNITPEQELKIRQRADKEAEDIVNRRRIVNPFQRNEEYQRVRQEQYKNMIEQFRYGSAGIPEAKRTYSVPGVGTFDMITGRLISSLAQENLADQAKARAEAEGERRNNAAGKDKIVVLGGVTGGDQPGPSRGRSTGAHLHAQFGPGITEAQAIQLVYKAIDFGAQTPQVGGRRFAGHGYPGLDFPMAASRFTLKPGYSGTDLGIQGTLGRGMRISGPGGSFEIGHLRDVTTGKESQRLDEQQKVLNESYDAAQRLAQDQQKLAEQRAKEQKDTIERNQKLAEQAQQQEDSYFASLQATKDQARLLGVMTEGQRLLEEFANNILDIERDTAKAKAEALTEDAAALAVADGELKKQNALNKLYQDQAALKSSAMSES